MADLSAPPSTDSGTPSGRPGRWVCIGQAAALAAVAAGAIGLAASHRAGSDDPAMSSPRQEPLPGIRRDPRAVINNAIVGRGWVANLDGIAVVYEAEADGLIAPDGHFRTDLSAEDAGRILRLNREAIADAASPGRIDPRAVLFRAQSGTLTEASKARARKERRQQAAEGIPPDAAYGDWVVRDFAFTLERLERPGEEERAVLSAISRSKRLIAPEPGDTIRAVPICRGDLGDGKVALGPGILPPQLPMTLAEMRPGGP